MRWFVLFGLFLLIYAFIILGPELYSEANQTASNLSNEGEQTFVRDIPMIFTLGIVMLLFTILFVVIGYGWY